jgi:uridine kinase
MTHKRSIIAGIAGGSASGKTTFTGTLLQTFGQAFPHLTVETFGMDKYFYRGAPGGPIFVSPSTGERLPHNNHPNSADNARFVEDVLQRAQSEDAPDVLVIEGLMILHVDAIREMLDIRFFIELEPDIRALRRLLRDMKGGRGSTEPEWIARYYQECARVGHNDFVEPSRVHADLIIRGDSDFARTAPLAAAAIASLVPNK